MVVVIVSASVVMVVIVLLVVVNIVVVINVVFYPFLSSLVKWCYVIFVSNTTYVMLC